MSRSSSLLKAFGLILIGLTTSTIASAAGDEAMLVSKQITTNMMAGWNSHDGNAYGAEFWTDAEFVNVFGVVTEGQPAIAALTQRMVTGPLKDRVSLMTIRKARMLAPNVILAESVDTDSSGTTKVTTRMKLVIERRGDTWRIIAAQNTVVSPPTF